MWLKAAPYVALVILGGLLALAKARIDTLDAELDRAGAECNTRIANGAAAAEQAAREATDNAIRNERLRWQQLVARSKDAVRRADQARADEAARVATLTDELNELYRSSPDAQNWRDTPIPDDVRRLLE